MLPTLIWKSEWSCNFSELWVWVLFHIIVDLGKALEAPHFWRGCIKTLLKLCTWTHKHIHTHTYSHTHTHLRGTTRLERAKADFPEGGGEMDRQDESSFFLSLPVCLAHTYTQYCCRGNKTSMGKECWGRNLNLGSIPTNQLHDHRPVNFSSPDLGFLIYKKRITVPVFLVPQECGGDKV